MLESGLNASAAMFLLFSKANVLDLLLEGAIQPTQTYTRISAAHLTKSKTETRLPTGLRMELPSGVKTTFP